jgi:hypothetical protein
VPTELRDLFRDIAQRLPEVWPTLTNGQQKELLRSLIQQVIIRRPAADQVTVRIVWLSGAYSEKASLTPIHCERDVPGYEQLVARVQELWQQGYNDVQIAERVSEEGYHSARSVAVTARNVMKIRLQRKWYRPYERLRGADEVEGYWTVNGLAKRLAVSEHTIYRLISGKIIPAEVIERAPESGLYLFHQDEALLVRLQEHIARKQQRTVQQKAGAPLVGGQTSAADVG